MAPAIQLQQNCVHFAACDEHSSRSGDRYRICERDSEHSPGGIRGYISGFVFTNDPQVTGLGWDDDVIYLMSTKQLRQLWKEEERWINLSRGV